MTPVPDETDQTNLATSIEISDVAGNQPTSGGDDAPVWLYEPGDIALTKQSHREQTEKWATNWGVYPNSVILPRWGGAPWPKPSPSTRLPVVPPGARSQILVHPVLWIIEPEWQWPFEGEDIRGWALRSRQALEDAEYILDGVTSGHEILTRFTAACGATNNAELWEGLYSSTISPITDGLIHISDDAEYCAEDAAEAVRLYDEGWDQKMEVYREQVWGDTIERLGYSNIILESEAPLSRDELHAELELLGPLLIRCDLVLGDGEAQQAWDIYRNARKRYKGSPKKVGEAERRFRTWMYEHTLKLLDQTYDRSAEDALDIETPNDGGPRSHL